MAVNVFDLNGRFNLDTTAYERQLDDSVSLASVTFSKIADFAKKGMQMVSDFLKDSVQTASSFDSAMSQVAATMGKASDSADVQRLREFAKEMGETTRYSAIESAQALNYMALAGYDVEKSIGMLPNVMNLASAGAMDLARASDMVTDTQTAFGLSIEDTEKMVDIMAKTASKSNTSVEQLGDAFLTVGAAARSMIQDGDTSRLAAVFGVLADNGRKASEAGTSVRNILMSMTSKKALQGFEALGISTIDGNGNLRDVIDVMRELRDATSGMGTGERSELLSGMFNKYDIVAVESLLSTTDERWKQLITDIQNADGAASNMAQAQNDNLQGAITMLNSAKEGLKIAVGESFMPIVVAGVQQVTGLVSDLTNRVKNSDILKQIKTTTSLLADAVKTGDTDKIMKQVKGSLHKWIRIFTREIIPEGIAGIINTIFGEDTIDVNILKNFLSNAGEKLFNGLTKAWEIGKQLWNDVIQPVGQWFFKEVLPPTVSILQSIWDIAVGIWNVLFNDSENENTISTFMGEVKETGGNVAETLEKISGGMRKIADLFKETDGVDFGGFWENLFSDEFWDNWKDGFEHDILPLFEQFEEMLKKNEQFKDWVDFWNTLGGLIQVVVEWANKLDDAIAKLISKAQELDGIIAGWFKDSSNLGGNNFWDNWLIGMGLKTYDGEEDAAIAERKNRLKGHGAIGEYARGGVLTRPTRILAGEAGAEVVMPLQNNTGWIDVLASKIKASNSGNNDTAKPIINVSLDGAIFQDEYSMDVFVEKLSEKLGALNIQQIRALGGVN